MNGTFACQLAIPGTGELSMELYDLSGRQVLKNHHSVENTGSYEVAVDASDLPSGIYILNARMGDRMETAQVVICR